MSSIASSPIPPAVEGGASPALSTLIPAREALSSEGRFLSLSPQQQVAAVKSGVRAPASMFDRVRIWLMLGRPRTCIPPLLGFMLGAGYAGLAGWMTAVGATVAFLWSFLANLGNTYTDVEEDVRNLPGRVYLMAKLGYRHLFWSVMGVNAALLLGAAALGLRCLAFMAVALVLVHEYSFGPVRAKARPVLCLWVFAQVVGFPILFAAFLAPESGFVEGLFAATLGALGDGANPAPSQQAQRLLAAYGVFTLVYMAKGMFKNVPDYYGDRDAGLRTSATLFPTWRGAATSTMAATIGAHLTLVGLVVSGLESPRLLGALLWLVPMTWNCLRLLRADGPSLGNSALKTDMLLSVAFLATVLLLAFPTLQSLVGIAAGVGILFASDLVQLDSRRESDVIATTA